jgi:hypothetical protein
MVVARDRQQWNHTAAVMTLIANVNSKRKFSPSDFNPYIVNQVSDRIDVRTLARIWRVKKCPPPQSVPVEHSSNST